MRTRNGALYPLLLPLFSFTLLPYPSATLLTPPSYYAIDKASAAADAEQREAALRQRLEIMQVDLLYSILTILTLYLLYFDRFASCILARIEL